MTYKGKNRRVKDKPNVVKELAERRKAFEAMPNADELWEEIKLTGFAAARRKYQVSANSLKVKLVEYRGTDELVYKMTSAIDRNNLKTDGNHLRGFKSDSYPPVDEMVARVTSDGYESLARELGVSGNAIRKYLTHRLGYTPKRAGWGDKSKGKDQDNLV